MEIAINAIAIEILDPAGKPTSNGTWPKGSRNAIFMSNQILNEKERVVAGLLGLDIEAVAAMKRSPIVGVSLHGENGAPKKALPLLAIAGRAFRQPFGFRFTD